jgi:hypothetical protein
MGLSIMERGRVVFMGLMIPIERLIRLVGLMTRDEI